MRRTLFIGWPLLVALEREQIHAIVCHELSHANRYRFKEDAIVTASLRALEHWKLMIYDALLGAQEGVVGLFRPLGWVAVKLIQGYQFSIMYLDWLQSQRSEFEADSMALMGTSRESLVEALRRLPYGDVVDECLQEATLQRRDFAGILKSRAPEKLVGRLFANEQRLSADETLAPTTHPSLRDRIGLLALQGGGVKPDTRFVEQLSRDVAPKEDVLAFRMLQAYGETCTL